MAWDTCALDTVPTPVTPPPWAPPHAPCSPQDSLLSDAGPLPDQSGCVQPCSGFPRRYYWTCTPASSPGDPCFTGPSPRSLDAGAPTLSFSALSLSGSYDQFLVTLTVSSGGRNSSEAQVFLSIRPDALLRYRQSCRLHRAAGARSSVPLPAGVGSPQRDMLCTQDMGFRHRIPTALTVGAPSGRHPSRHSGSPNTGWLQGLGPRPEGGNTFQGPWPPAATGSVDPTREVHASWVVTCRVGTAEGARHCWVHKPKPRNADVRMAPKGHTLPLSGEQPGFCGLGDCAIARVQVSRGRATSVWTARPAPCSGPRRKHSLSVGCGVRLPPGTR